MMRSTLVVLLALAASARAAEPGDDLDGLQALLDTGVVSGASRTQERSDDAPATITVVTADELRRYGLRTVHEAINFLSVGLVAQDPLHAVEVGSRGVLLTADYGNHVLVLLDGHAMNEQWNGTAYFEQGVGVPMEFVDHLELIVGPGSVLYGSSAMLGVINIVTKRARDLSGVQFTSEWSAAPPQDVNAAPQLGPLERFGGTGRVSLLVGHEASLLGAALRVSLALEYFAHRGQSLTFATQDQLPTQWGPRAPGPFSWGGATTSAWWTEAPSALLRVRWGDFTLWARGALYARSAPAYDTLGVTADFDTGDQERDRWFNVELGWSRTLSPRVRLVARAYLDLYDYLGASRSSAWDLLGTGDPLPAGLDPEAFTFRSEMRAGSRWGGLETQATIDWLGDGRFPLMLGVDARGRHFHDSTVVAQLDGEVFGVANAYEADEWQAGVYLQQRARPVPQLLLNAGIRADFQAVFPMRYAPRAAVVWLLPWQGRLKAVFNRAFRAPSGYERFGEFAAYQVRNPALRPEIVTTGELGYEQRLGRHRVHLVGFVSNYERLVQFQPVPEDVGPQGLFWYENHGSILNAGGSAAIEGAVGQLGYGASFTGAVNVSDEALVASPTWFGNARVSWGFGDGLPRLSLAGAFSGERLITTAAALGPNGETWAPGTEKVGPQVELRATVDGPVPGVKGLTLRGVVGGQLMPFSAYTVGPRQAPEPGFDVPAQAPNSRLFFMLTASWVLGAP